MKSEFFKARVIDQIERREDGDWVRDTTENNYIINIDMIVDIFPPAGMIRMIDGSRHTLTGESMEWLLKALGHQEE